MKLVTMTREDLPRVERFLYRHDDDFFPPLTFQDFMSHTDLPHKTEHYLDSGRIISAIDDNHIVGIILYGYGTTESDAYICELVVDKSQRGKGYGKALFEACLDDLRARKETSVCLTTWSTDTGARHLYEKHGFVVTSVEKDARKLGVDTINYRLKI